MVRGLRETSTVVTLVSVAARRECVPRYATKRTPGRKTHGKRVGVVAEALGTPFMPWQQYVADVLGEVNPLTGRLAYREGRITVPRQSGKTAFLLPQLVYRCLGALGVRQRVVYTAQTRAKAREKWETEHVDQLRRSAFAGLFDVRLAQGSERLTWPHTGSIHGIDAVTDKAGHGGTLDVSVIDEAFARPDWSVEQSMRPAMVTRPNAQLLVVSTAGYSETQSPYLWAKIEDGRARAEAGQDSGIAYFEWSDDPDSDPDDEDNWFTFMPALGHTIDLDAIRADRDALAGRPAEWDRAYRNIWPGARTVTQAIPAESWAACRDDGAEIDGRVLWGVDVSEDRGLASIAASGYTDTGRELIEVIDYRGGTGWIVPRLIELRDRHGKGNDIVALDSQGPAASLIPDLEDAGFTVLRLSTRDKAGACGALYDAAVHVDEDGNADRLVHRGQLELDGALAGADKRRLGDVWEWSRGASLADITPLVAATIARWALTVSEDIWQPSALA